MTEENNSEPTPNMADHPVLADINAVCAEIEEAQARLKSAKQRLHEAVAELPVKIGDNDDLREEIIYHLYWFDDRIPKNTLKSSFNVIPPSLAGKNSKNVIRSLSVKIHCYHCHKQSIYTPKSSNVLPDRFTTCDTCTTRRNKESHEHFVQLKTEQARVQQRIQELRTMPYYEYLRTPEWQERRKRAMKKAGYRCQVCNSYGVQLNTHHRTYERRGNEYDSDLITLCQGCHQIFHESGKLAEE